MTKIKYTIKMLYMAAKKNITQKKSQNKTSVALI